MKNKKLKLLGLTLAMGLAGSASAQLAGKNVILIHGFQSGDLSDPPASQQEVEQRGDAYWQAFWASRAEARIDWASNERVEGGIAQRAFNQLKTISQSGLCSSGCVLVTHSTGDLVGRYVVDNQARWLSNAGYQPLNILTSLDFAGAGGGTELADLAVNIAYSDTWYNWTLKQAVKLFTGIDPQPGKLGVVNDLQTTAARNLATSPNAVPRLRFVGGGSQNGGITKPFIKGSDDAVVPLHSACGAATAGAFDSCSSSVALDGKRTSVSAPGSLYYNHYPILMGADVNHGDAINTNTGNALTYANNNLSFNGINVDFDTYTFEKKPWWQFWGSGDTYQRVRDGEQYSVSGIVYQTLNH
ncbi:hypothetical protein QQM79_08405 [Marinobacteraceae bacterium S3BR75-40.1]